MSSHRLGETDGFLSADIISRCFKRRTEVKRRRLLVFVLSLCMIFNGVSLLESSAAEANDGQGSQTSEEPQVLEDENQTR